MSTNSPTLHATRHQHLPADSQPHGAPSRTRRQEIEAAVYDERTRTWAATLTESDLMVDASRPPFPNQEHEDFLTHALDFLGDVRGKRVLEVGCGSGTIGTWLALRGAEVLGIDVSEEIVGVANRRADLNGVADRARFLAVPVEQLDEPDGSFDLIVGNQVLHHFELPDALPNLRRLLKPGGRAAFCEPVLLLPEGVRQMRDSRLVTRLFPRRVDTPTERSLGIEDLRLIRRVLPGTRIIPFQLLARVRNFVALGDAWFERLAEWDRFLLRHAPPVRPLCRFVAIEYTSAAA